MDHKTATAKPAELDTSLAGALLLLWAPNAEEAPGRFLQLDARPGSGSPAGLPPGYASGLAHQLRRIAQQLEQGEPLPVLAPAALGSELRLRPLEPGQQAARTLRSGPFQIDPAHGLVRWRGPGGWRPLELTEVERRLLRQLLQAAGDVCSREDLAQGLWGDAAHHLRTVDQCVRRLRASLLAAGVPDCIRTVRGLGYRLQIGQAAVR